MKRVLVLSTYPLVLPRHGGQVRLSNIVMAYSSAGWDVKTLAVYEPEGFGKEEVAETDVCFPVDAPERHVDGKRVHVVNDLLASRFVENESNFHLFKDNLEEDFDIIHVEQPWMWPLAEIASKQGSSKPLLIYGSQNIESAMKKDMLQLLSPEDQVNFINSIDALERRAAKGADICLAVTPSDKAVIEGWGAKKVVLAPNGVSPINASSEAKSKWRRSLPRGIKLLYIASAHLPNYSGFFDYLGEGLGCIPPDATVIIVGGAGSVLKDIALRSRWSDLIFRKTLFLGSVSDEDLAAIKELADVYILPVQGGGGSSLKAAEALYSGKPVFSSASGLRGFEEFHSDPLVKVFQDGEGFRNGLRDFFSGGRGVIKVCQAGIGYRSTLTWGSALNSIVPEISSVLGEWNGKAMA